MWEFNIIRSFTTHTGRGLKGTQIVLRRYRRISHIDSLLLGFSFQNLWKGRFLNRAFCSNQPPFPCLKKFLKMVHVRGLDCTLAAWRVWKRPKMCHEARMHS